MEYFEGPVMPAQAGIQSCVVSGFPLSRERQIGMIQCALSYHSVGT